MINFSKFLIIFTVFSFSNLYAETLTSNLLNKTSKIFSDAAVALIPGEGITEASIEFNDEEKPDFSILAVRDIIKNEKTNFFTQVGLHNDEVANDERYIINYGLGYRLLSFDESMLFGINSFLDADFVNRHSRTSIGLEAKAAMVEFSLNRYVALSGKKEISDNDEQALSGLDINLSSQLPYTPWAVFNWQKYKYDADLAAIDSEGDIYSLEFALYPSLQVDFLRENNNSADPTDGSNKNGIRFLFVHPPRNNKPTLADGLSSNVAFYKANMQSKLSEKIRRNNNIAVEVRGAVIFTKK